MGEILTGLQKDRRQFERKIKGVGQYTQLLLESPDMANLRMIEKTINTKSYEDSQNLIKIKKEHEEISGSIGKSTEIYNFT